MRETGSPIETCLLDSICLVALLVHLICKLIRDQQALCQHRDLRRRLACQQGIDADSPMSLRPAYSHTGMTATHRMPACTDRSYRVRKEANLGMLLPADADIKAGACHGKVCQAGLHSCPQGACSCPPALTQLQCLLSQLSFELPHPCMHLPSIACTRVDHISKIVVALQIMAQDASRIKQRTVQCSGDICRHARGVLEQPCTAIKCCCTNAMLIACQAWQP